MYAVYVQDNSGDADWKLLCVTDSMDLATRLRAVLEEADAAYFPSDYRKPVVMDLEDHDSDHTLGVAYDNVPDDLHEGNKTRLPDTSDHEGMRLAR